MRVLSICTGMGLLCRAFMDAGFEVVPGCEIDPRMRRMHEQLCGGEYLCHDIQDLPAIVTGMHFDGVIGGPPCQALSKTRAMRPPKYGDLTVWVLRVLAAAKPLWFLFENVASLGVQGAQHIRLDAMHFGKPHQSRPRWFTYAGIAPPSPLYAGTIDSLMAYPAVAARIYGPKRGAILQGYPAVSQLKAPCVDLQLGLANGVHYGLASAWAQQVVKCGTMQLEMELAHD